MSKRIKELYKRARKLQVSIDDFVLDEWEKKFAELLIKECMEIPNWCVETGKDQLVETCMAERATAMIQKHFGVA